MEKKIEIICRVLLYPIFIYLEIDVEIMKILCVLMILDSFVGSIKAIRLKQKATFKILLYGLLLKLLILFVPMVVALVGIGVGYNMKMIVDWVIKIMIISEGTSIVENIYSIKTGNEVKNRIDVIAVLLKTLRESMRRLINHAVKSIKESGDCSGHNEDQSNTNI